MTGGRGCEVGHLGMHARASGHACEAETHVKPPYIQGLGEGGQEGRQE